MRAPKGLFINRNHQIAPHFKEYAIEKKRILSSLKNQYSFNAKANKEMIEEQKRQFGQFQLVKW